MSETSQNKDPISVWQSFKILLGSTRSFWAINLANFCDGIAYFGILNLLIPFLGTRVGMSDAAAGVTVSTFTGLVTLFMFGGGYVSDFLGVRRALSLSLGLLGLGRVFLVLAPVGGHSLLGSLFTWVGVLLMAAGSGILQPALYAGIKEYSDPRTATIGFSLVYSIMNLGIVAESFISPMLRTDTVFNLKFIQFVGRGWGIDGVFWFCIMITGFAFLMNIILFTPKVEAKERNPDVPPPGEFKWKEKLKEILALDRTFVAFIFILLPVRTLFAHQWLTMPSYVFRCFPTEVNSRYEWIQGLNPLIIVLFVPLIAILTRKVKVINMMIVGTAFSAVTTFLLVPGPHLHALIWYVILFSLGEAMWSSRFYEFVADISPAGKVGAYMGLAGIPWFLAKFTTGLYSGTMIHHFIPKEGPQNSSTLWLIYAITACLTPILLILCRRWLLTWKDAHHQN
jgi:proton-dependent oligopeptide transporter, POT family